MNLTEQSPRSCNSQTGGRRPTSSVRGSPRNTQGTDTESTTDLPSLGQQRSVSWVTLQPTVIEPRMSQLETLEAKMASIEVSLLSTPRRKKNGSITGVSLTSSIRSIPKELAVKELESLRNALRDKENIIQSLKGQLTVPGLRLGAIRQCNNNNNNIRELTEVEKKQAEDRLTRLKTDIDNKRLTIKNLKMALERLDITDNIDVRIQQAELEYQLGREELNLLTLLEESRALQSCIEESNKVSCEHHTLYSCAEGKDYVILQAVEIEYDPKSPKFGAGPKDSVPGLYVDWALEESHLLKGDRLIEVNGKIVLNRNRDDLNRLLVAAPDPAQIVVLRKIPINEASAIFNSTSREVNAILTELEATKERVDESQRVKEVLRSDNIRLTHRISYLEEQVSELLSRKPMELDSRIISVTPVISKSNQNITNINIRTHSPANSSSTNPDIQTFQKGNQLTAPHTNGLDPKEQVAYQIRSKSSLSNVSNTHIPAPNGEYICQKGHHARHKHRNSRSGVQSPVGTTQVNDKITYRKHNHHHHHTQKDYSSETNSGVDHVKRYNKRNNENNRYSEDFTKVNSEKEYSKDIMDQSFKKATKIVHELTRSRDTTLYEKHRQKCLTASEKYNADILRHYNARKSTSVLDFRSEVHIGPKYDSKSVEDLDASEVVNTDKTYRWGPDSRSVKSLDFDSDCNSTTTTTMNHRIDYTSEPTNDKKHIYYPGGYDMKPRPIPPKKPLRLSLHKTHSLQSVENGEDSYRRTERKRNYKGEKPALNSKNHDQNGGVNGYREQQIKWNLRRSLENSLENGSWC